MGQIVRWEPPPPRREGKWVPYVDALRERPDEWGLVLEGVSRYEAYAGANALRNQGCQIATRRVSEDGPLNLYARWSPSRTGE